MLYIEKIHVIQVFLILILKEAAVLKAWKLWIWSLQPYIPECIVRPTGITRSYHSSKFIDIGSNSNSYKYNFFALNEWNT